jgi:protein CSF1
MQVELQLTGNHSLIALPVGLPGYEYCPLPGQPSEDVHLGGCVVLSVPEIEVQLRSHNLGLEMNLNTGTIYGAVESDYTERSMFSRPQRSPSSEVMLIEGYRAAYCSKLLLTFP